MIDVFRQNRRESAYVMQKDTAGGANCFSEGQFGPKIPIGDVVKRQDRRESADAAEGEQTPGKARATFVHGAEIKCWGGTVNGFAAAGIVRQIKNFRSQAHFPVTRGGREDPLFCSGPQVLMPSQPSV